MKWSDVGWLAPKHVNWTDIFIFKVVNRALLLLVIRWKALIISLLSKDVVNGTDWILLWWHFYPTFILFITLKSLWLSMVMVKMWLAGCGEGRQPFKVYITSSYRSYRVTLPVLYNEILKMQYVRDFVRNLKNLQHLKILSTLCRRRLCVVMKRYLQKLAC